MEPSTKHYLEATAPRPVPESDVTLGAAVGGPAAGAEGRR
jgi:hypothetical protein